MISIPIKTTSPYHVIIENSLLSSLGDAIKSVCLPQKVLVVSDTTVFSLYGESAMLSLKESGFSAFSFTFSPGEAQKSMDTVLTILDTLGNLSFTRTDLILALGGGITGDISGFAASIYLRGIPFVQAPTTLLAAVDSSVGGKTGVNLSFGKNLVGSFYQPRLVLCDPLTFHTLPSHIFADGVAEAIKCGVLKDPALFSLLASGKTTQCLEEVISRTVSIKGEIVAEDEKDLGTRQLLNFGHTLAHAIEKASDYHISHGHAVAMGMVAVSRAAKEESICDDLFLFSLINCLKANNLPTEVPYPINALAPFLAHDKKRKGDTVTVVVPKRIGECGFLYVDNDQLPSFFARGLSK